MQSVAQKLKVLRKSAVPALTVRGIAEALGMPFGTYSSYETPSRYKKSALPLDLTRRIAAVLAKHNVDPAEVMKLAGLTETEAEPEAREIEAARPPVRFISLPVALPSEAALADMFESLLALVPEDATRAEAARILAQRLPSGFAAIGPVLPDPGMAFSPAPAAAPPAAATDHPAP